MKFILNTLIKSHDVIIRKRWGAVPVIVHTGHAEGELIDQVLTFSPFTLLAKPCSPTRVLEVIRKIERGMDTVMWRKNHHNVPKPEFQRRPIGGNHDHL